MHKEINDFPEYHRRILQRFSRLMGALENEYQKSRPQHGAQGFKEHVHGDIKTLFVEDASAAFLPTGEVNVERIFQFIVGDGQTVESDVAWIYVSCANAMAAMWAMEQEDRDRAWDFLCDASFYLGTVLVTNRGEAIFTEAVVGTYKSAIGKRRGSMRHAATNAMKSRAYEIMRSQGPWVSQARAVAMLENILKSEFSTTLKNPEDTITGWIREMPDREELIPSLKKRA